MLSDISGYEDVGPALNQRLRGWGGEKGVIDVEVDI